MFVFKSKYYLILENTNDLNLNCIKIRNKFVIIYRNKNLKENIQKIKKFRKDCKKKGIEFFVANDKILTVDLQADGFYISANNLKQPFLDRKKFKIIGAAHNYKELYFKRTQGCSKFIFSRLFSTSYPYKKGHLGLIKFNNLLRQFKFNLIPLGGIRLINLNKLSLVSCNSFVIFSEIKKKPAKIISRLF